MFETVLTAIDSLAGGGGGDAVVWMMVVALDSSAASCNFALLTFGGPSSDSVVSRALFLTFSIGLGGSATET